MKKVDLNYLCENISSLSGIPIRIFRKNQQDSVYSAVNLSVDPAKLYTAELLNINKRVGYYITPDFTYYGLLKYGEQTLVIGPARQINPNKQQLSKLAFELDVPENERGEFISSMQAIPDMSVSGFLQMLCLINYVLNDENLSAEDICIYDNLQTNLFKDLERERLQKIDEYPADSENADVHNTYKFEKNMLGFITNGDVSGIKNLFSGFFAGKTGKLSGDFIRQQKNTFIVVATLASRAAIKGGMDIEEAFSLSDAYIQRCELLSDFDSIANLQYHMIMNYTKKISSLGSGGNADPLISDIKTYIRKHLSEPIKSTDIADCICMSRGHLSKCFKEETGVTLSEFIINEKIGEAKRLLSFTDKSLVNISNYLGFSSQSHFNNTFKKFTGTTPKEYRRLNLNT